MRWIMWENMPEVAMMLWDGFLHAVKMVAIVIMITLGIFGAVAGIFEFAAKIQSMLQG